MSDDGLRVQSGSRRRRIVGTFNPGVLVFAACCALILFAIAWLWVASPTNDASDMVKALPPICIVLTVEILIATSRIVVDPAGFIDVIGPLAIQRVPTVDLVAVEHDNGLQLRLTSGRRIESFAYGSSLLGFLLRYPRAKRAARRIEAAIGDMGLGRPNGDDLPWRQDSATSVVRLRGFLATLGVNALLVGGTVGLHIFS